jgi:hypothetical protein
MSKEIKITLSVALVLSTVSGAIAADKHAAHRQRAAVERQVPPSALAAGASASQIPGSGRLGETGAILIQDRDFSASFNSGYCGGKC